MTFNDFKLSWEIVILPNKPNEIRRGQSLMSFLAQEWFLEYNRIVLNGLVDCFYQDSIIDATLKHLEKEWVNYTN